MSSALIAISEGGGGMSGGGGGAGGWWVLLCCTRRVAMDAPSSEVSDESEASTTDLR